MCGLTSIAEAAPSWADIVKRAGDDDFRSDGKVFSTVWSPDEPLTLAAAGSKAMMQIWDVGSNFGVRKAFSSKLAAAGRELKEIKGGNGGLIGLANDEEEESDGGEGEGDE